MVLTFYLSKILIRHTKQQQMRGKSILELPELEVIKKPVQLAEQEKRASASTLWTWLFLSLPSSLHATAPNTSSSPRDQVLTSYLAFSRPGLPARFPSGPGAL